MQAREAKQLSLPQLLSRLGYQPTKTSGYKLWYRSPLRSETRPSFCVEPGQQVAWIFSDYGANLKGNTLDFVRHYKQCSIKEALDWLDQIFGANRETPVSVSNSTAIACLSTQCNSSTASSPFALQHQCSMLTRSPIQICRIKSILHPALISYLKERAIAIAVARRYLREVHYLNSGRQRFALGWKTDAGGWALRSPNFKACVRPAGITSIGQDNQCLAVFEGMFDLLAALTYYQSLSPKGQVVVLNSVNHSDIVAKKILLGNYLCVRLYLDNDSAGRRATQHLLTLPNTVDCSALFSPAKDFAQWHEAAAEKKDNFSFPSKNSCK